MSATTYFPFMHATDSADLPSSDAQQPSQQDIDAIIALHDAGDLIQMEQASARLCTAYPAAAIAWSVLATALQLQGKAALPALQKTAELAPHDAETHYALGNALVDSGQADLAMGSFMRVLELSPGHAAALCRLGDVLQTQGHIAEATECYRGALEIDPNLAIAHVGKGDMLQRQRHYQAAEASYRQALTLTSEVADIHRKLADVQVALNRPEPAMQSYLAALQGDPANAMAHGGLGNVLFRLDRNAQAAASFRAATALPSATAVHYHGLGRSLHALGETADAETAYRKAIELDASIAAPMLHYADLLRETRRKEAAIAVYQAALLLEPQNIDALNNLGMALQEDGQLEQALASFQQVASLSPNNPVSHSNIAAILNAMGQQDAALESCRRAVKLGPNSAAAHVNLGTCLMEMGRLDEAIKSLQTVVRLDPHHRRAHVNIGSALSRLGRIEDAIKHVRQALKINPDWDELQSNLLFYMTHSQKIDAAALFAEHVRYATHVEGPLRASWPQHANSREPERCLRVGFVSADLYHHAVSHFFTPVLEHLAQSTSLQLVAYANSFHDDATSRRLHGLFSLWRQVEKLTHAELAQLIASDRIDILIDLSGHTGFNRLPTFARKPAPLQLSWIGYPGTTGLQAMDYYIADRFLAPPGLLDDQFSETFLYLPATAPFLHAADAPPVSTAPAVANGHITFGSFNRLEKLNRETIARWSRLLRAIPSARMLVGGMPNTQTIDMLRSWFSKAGVKADRLSFHLRTDTHAYLQLHDQVDICLDSHPYSSGTTGFHALWMGVPTLTLPGPTLTGHAASAIMSYVGLSDFIATDEDDFVARGEKLAADIAYLAALRRELRDRLKASAAGQPELIAHRLEAALRAIWRHWCAGLPAATFSDVSQSSISH